MTVKIDDNGPFVEDVDFGGAYVSEEDAKDIAAWYRLSLRPYSWKDYIPGSAVVVASLVAGFILGRLL
jgi:hypothetical protein